MAPGGSALDVSWLVAVFLLSLRLTATFLLTPVLAAASVPVVVRVLLVLGLAAALSLGLPPASIAAASALTSTGPLLAAAGAELALGATLALGILLAFGAFSVAGNLLDVQIGFGLAQVIDPASNARAPILTSAFGQLAAVVFFALDGHHALLRGIAYSLERFPLGTPWRLEAAFGPTVTQAAGLFSLGFALAAPVVFCILLLDVALGVVSRNLPQMNMLAVGIPAKVVIGLVALSLWSSGAGDVMGRVYGSLYRSWDTTFGASAAAVPGPALGPAEAR